MHLCPHGPVPCFRISPSSKPNPSSPPPSFLLPCLRSFGITAMLLTVFIIGADVVMGGGHAPHDAYEHAAAVNGTLIDAVTGAIGHATGGGGAGAGGHLLL